MLAAVAAGACSGSRTGREADETVVVIDQEVEGLDPRFAVTGYQVKLSRLLFDALVTVDNEALEPRLDLAVEMVRPDDRTYELTLRPGVRFHDGSVLTARDVVATYRSVLGGDAESPYRGTYSRIERVEALGERRVRFRLEAPHAPFVTDLILPILPARLVEGRPGRIGWEELVGSGPFRLERHEPGRIELAAFPGHFRGAPTIGRLTFRTIRDDNSRVLTLVGGGADLALNTVPPHLVRLFEDHEGFEVESAPGCGFAYLLVNLRDPDLADVRVRRALAAAIDRDRLVEGKLGGRAVLSSGLLAPGHWAYESRARGQAHDPAEARRLLAAARAGRGPLRVTIETSASRFRIAMARALAHYFRAVGVEADVRPLEFGTMMGELRAGRFQLALMEIPEVSEPHIYSWFFHSSSIPTPDHPDRGANRAGWIDPRADALMDRGRVTTDRDERREIYRELQRVMADALPVVPLWHPDNVLVRSRDLQGFEMAPNARFNGLARAVRLPAAGRARYDPRP